MPEITGYRELNEDEVMDINNVKNLGTIIEETIETLQKMSEYDQDWVALGKTHLQQGLMCLVRAIARPTTF